MELYITNFRSFIEISFKVEGLAKPIQALVLILTKMVEKLQSYDTIVRIVKYKIDIKKYE